MCLILEGCGQSHFREVFIVYTHHLAHLHHIWAEFQIRNCGPAFCVYIVVQT